jgi:hypothetical protein
MLCSDSQRAGSVSSLSTPEGVLSSVPWERVNEMFPPGSTARSRLLVITYNGSMRSVGNHFNNTVSRTGFGGNTGRRIMENLRYFEWNIIPGASLVGCHDHRGVG